MLSELPFLDSLFNNANQNCIMIMDTDGVVLSLNKAFTSCFGYKEGDLVGKSATILYTEEDQKKCKLQNELKEVQITGQSNDNNYLVKSDSVPTWVSGESVLVRNRQGETVVFKVIQNIHLQKTTEISLRELNTFNENILESISDGVIVLNKQMEVVKSNNAFLSAFNFQKPGFINFDFAAIIAASDSGRHIIEKLHLIWNSKAGFSNEHIEIKLPTGEKRVFEVTGSPFLNDAADHILLIFHDVTVYKELEKEREDIIGFITHELRNPLSNVLLLNEVMREAVKTKDLNLVEEMIKRSEKNAQRMNKMIGGLYNATKVSSGQLSFEFSNFLFIDMVKEAVETVQVLEPSFKITVEGDGNFMVFADRYRMIQVITNYLSNAIKYSNQSKEVILSISAADNMVTVAVKDNGLGISKKHLPYVFDRFFRLEQSRNIEGIGLGLYLCRQIIHGHNGQVWVESQVNEGSTFFFSLPLTSHELQD